MVTNVTGEALPLHAEHLRPTGSFVGQENFAGLSVRNTWNDNDFSLCT